ncbi:MAG: COX15/CtaA family protein, partial [Cyclobacteriaceae bacterium]
HMGLALLLVCVLIYMVYRNSENQTGEKVSTADFSRLSQLLFVAMILFLGQIFIGTQVRESIDLIAARIADRSEWIDQLGLTFYIHRSYSIIILGLQIWMIWILKNYRHEFANLALMFRVLLVLVLAEILTGAGMAYFAIPGFLQPLHLLIATLIFGAQFYTYLSLKNLRSVNRIKTI